jgi:methyl-accepting chemotaxis protein
VNNAITEVNTVSKEVEQSVASQETATMQIANNIKTAANLVDTSTAIMGKFSAATQKVDHSSQEIFNSLNDLAKKSAQMDDEIHKFLTSLETA